MILVVVLLILVVLLVIVLIVVLVVILLILVVVFHGENLSLKFLNTRFISIMCLLHPLILIDKNFSYDKINTLYK